MSDSEHENDLQDDEEINPVAHKKLLQAVGQLTKNQHIRKPTRSEPALVRDEFHLVKPVSIVSDKVSTGDVVKLLKQTSKHIAAGKELSKSQNRKKTLQKPLEKPVAERIQRTIGYEKTKKSLSKWDAVVERNRASEHQVYPLDYEVVHADLPAPRKPRPTSIKSDLMLEMEEVENKLRTLKGLKAAENEEDERKLQENLTREELKARRKELAYLRVRESQKSAKARMRNKIKSKKYHKILKREKLKEGMKEFELLQKTNPELALEKLETIEKTRILERANLRHKNTGTWAKNLQVRAKYDKDVRKDLAEQLAISRELTQKQKADEESNSEGEEDDKVEEDFDPFNPWFKSGKKIEQAPEVSEYMSGYRKYWMERNKNEKALKELREENGDKPKGSGKNVVLDTTIPQETESITINSPEVPEMKAKSESNDNSSEENEDTDGGVSDADLEDFKALLNNTVKSSKEKAIQTPKLNHNINKKLKEILQDENVNDSSDPLESLNDLVVWKETGDEKSEAKIINSNKQIKQSFNKIGSAKSKAKSCDLRKNKIGNDWQDQIIPNAASKNARNKIDLADKRNKKSTASPKLGPSPQPDANSKRKRKSSISKCFIGGTCWLVEDLSDVTKSKAANPDIDDIFDDAENALRKKAQSKLIEVKQSLKSIKKAKKNQRKKLKRANNSKDLSFKKQASRPIIDEELLETPASEKPAGPDIERDTLKLAISSIDETPAENGIDPTNVAQVKPKRLRTALPDMVNSGEFFEGKDTNSDPQMTIAEAFEDDDIVADFERDREEDRKKTTTGDVDLTLPGWGSWAGSGISKKQSTKRLILKFPTDAPRRDDNKQNVYINEKANKNVKRHLVADLPFPFKSVQEYESSIRAPVGRTFVPETAFRMLTRPETVTKLGAVIEPMNDEFLMEKPKRPKTEVDRRIAHMNKIKSKS